MHAAQLAERKGTTLSIWDMNPPGPKYVHNFPRPFWNDVFLIIRFFSTASSWSNFLFPFDVGCMVYLVSSKPNWALKIAKCYQEVCGQEQNLLLFSVTHSNAVCLHQ